MTDRPKNRPHDQPIVRNYCTRKEDFFLLFVLFIKTEGKKEEESVESLCASISPVDKANAEKPGTDYETEIGDDCKQQQS